MAAILKSLGKTVVPVAGVPVAVAVPAIINPPTVHAFLVEVLAGNTGNVYVGTSDLVKSTLVGVLVVLPVPTANQLATFSVSITSAGNALALTDLYIDADVNGDGVLISAIVW